MANTDGDIEIVRGENDPPQVWQFLANEVADDADPVVPDDIFDLTGSVLFLTIYRLSTSEVLIDLNTTDDAHLELDIVNGKLTWTPTLAETRLLPLGRLCGYEVERRIDTSQGLMATGGVVVIGGLTSD